jgi:hypothetical protein
LGWSRWKRSQPARWLERGRDTNEFDCEFSSYCITPFPYSILWLFG